MGSNGKQQLRVKNSSVSLKQFLNDVDHMSSAYTKYGIPKEPIVINTKNCKLTNGVPVLQLVHEWFDGLVTNHANIVRTVIHSKNGIRRAKRRKEAKLSAKRKCGKKKLKQMKKFLLGKNAIRIDRFHELDVKPISPHDYSLWILHVDHPFSSTT